MTALKAVGGFVLGAIVAVVMPPLALAMALVLGGVLLWQRFRGEPVEGIGAPAGGFLAAVAAYVVLAVVSAVA